MINKQKSTHAITSNVCAKLKNSGNEFMSFYIIKLIFASNNRRDLYAKKG